MSVLVVDHDESSAQLVKSRIEAAGLSAQTAAGRVEAQTYLSTHPAVDIIFLDPAPLTQARQYIIQLRQTASSYVYVILMGQIISAKDAHTAGANMSLSKPFDTARVQEVVACATRMLDIQRHLNDTREDFPSGGGVIAKSAFCQLFYVALDRADRYGEQAFILFIRLMNLNQIKVNEGDYAAQVASATLAKVVSQFHRQSDILGQTGKSEYALLLYRPSEDHEPVEAALRFADMLGRHDQLRMATRTGIELEVELVSIPSGVRVAHHPFMIQPKG